MEQKKVYSWKTLKKKRAFSFLIVLFIFSIGLWQTSVYITKGAAYITDEVIHTFTGDIREETLKKKDWIIVKVYVYQGDTFETLQKELDNGELIPQRYPQFSKLNDWYNLDFIVAGKEYYFVMKKESLNQITDPNFKKRIEIIGQKMD